jgi:signal transduction histidine kinase/CBS domain-containing protein
MNGNPDTILTARKSLVSRILKVVPSMTPCQCQTSMTSCQCVEGQPGEEKVFAIFSKKEHVIDTTHLVGLLSLRNSGIPRQTRFADLLPDFPPVFINEDATLDQIWSRMETENVDMMAVSDTEGRFVGAVTRRSLVEALLHQERALSSQVARLESRCRQHETGMETLSRKLESTGEAYRTLLHLLVHTSIEDDLLQAGIEALAALIHARYGAIMLLGPEGDPVRFLVTGMTPQEVQKVGKNPEGRGLLGIDLEAMDVLCIDDISNDPRSCGFPPHHPLMRSVVMAPIANEGQIFGRVYLCDKIDGQPFSDDDCLIVQSFSHSLALLAGYARAVAERKQAEEATAYLDAQLRQARKLEALGRLAGGVAHDFNNLLTAIMGYGELTLVASKPDERIRRNIEEILKAARRGGSLVNQLLAFGGKQTSERVVVSLPAIISDLSLMIRRLIGEDIQVILRLDHDTGHILIDPGQMEQVILNLVVNARDAMPHGGTLFIEATRVELEEPLALQLGNLLPGPHVALSVKDTGCGMSSEIRARIFEPFFTTKEQGKGTGLGLSTVYGIIIQNLGGLSVESEVGQGTTFRVYLPRIGDHPHEPPIPVDQSTVPAEGTETVLVVEDEPEIRTLICKNLRTLGYTVLDAANGADALGIARQFTRPIHLLLTDMVMPQLGGQALADTLTGLHPEMTVLYISGYTNEPLVPEGALPRGSAFLQKPFTQEALGRKVRESLNGLMGEQARTQGDLR